MTVTLGEENKKGSFLNTHMHIHPPPPHTHKEKN